MAKESFITKLLKKEDINIEFKLKFDIKAILQTICAFLNGEGGWILIGYHKNRLLGIDGNTDAKVEELEDAALNEIIPQPLVYINKEKYQGKNLILVNVIKGSRQPYTFGGEYFIRKNGITKQANTDDISLLLRTSIPQASIWERVTVTDASIKDLDSQEIKNTIEDVKIKKRIESLPGNVESFLSYFKMMDYSSVSNAAMLLFGKNPVKFIPQCRIRIIVMPYGKSGGNFSDELLIEDNLFKSYERTIEYFKKNLPLISEFNTNTGDRETTPKYPDLALREAIINAIVHRDYADFSGDITINIYTDKLEIINSGEIPENIISHNKILPHHSVLRNPNIAHIFYLRGKMEKVGRGLNLIRDEFIEKGYKSPVWKSNGGYTTLILYTVSEQLNNRMKEFLNKLKKGSTFTSKEYESFFEGKISEKTARNDISVMVKSKYLIKEGQGPATIYKRTNKELPDIAG